MGVGPSASFAIQSSGCSGRCVVEGSLRYQLPDGAALDHKSDIQIQYERSGEASGDHRYVAIEVKHASAVTDQFKSRAFDMIHLKQQLGSRLHGIIIFARVGQGIQPARARSICYPFDDFIGAELSQGDVSAKSTKLSDSLAARIESAMENRAG